MGASLGDPSDLCALLKSQALNSQLSACLPAMVDALRNHVSRCQLMLTLHAQRMSLLEELYEHLKVNTQQRLDTLEQMYFALKRVVLAEAEASRKRRRWIRAMSQWPCSSMATLMSKGEIEMQRPAWRSRASRNHLLRLQLSAGARASVERGASEEAKGL